MSGDRIALNQGVQGSSPWRCREGLGACIYAGCGAFFHAMGYSGAEKSVFPAVQLIEMGYTVFRTYQLIGMVQVAPGGLYVLMPHEYHEPVYVHVAALLILVKAVVGGEVMPEPVGGELKGEL